MIDCVILISCLMLEILQSTFWSVIEVKEALIQSWAARVAALLVSKVEDVVAMAVVILRLVNWTSWTNELKVPEMSIQTCSEAFML